MFGWTFGRFLFHAFFFAVFGFIGGGIRDLGRPECCDCVEMEVRTNRGPDIKEKSEIGIRSRISVNEV